MIVYIDIIFLVNLLIDAALLLVTAKSRRLSFRWWRLLLSACIGAAYVVFLFFPPLSFLYTFAVKFILSLIMLLTAFGYGGVQHFWRNVGAFYIINFVAAGAVVGVHYFWMSSGEVINGILFTQSGGVEHRLQIGLLFLAAVLCFAFWLYRHVQQTAKKKEEMTAFFAQVDVHIDQFESSCTGLIDTGNQLYDPLTKTPVMVMELSQWGEKIPEAWRKRIERAEVDQIVTAIGTDEFEWQDRLRLVPYRGVNRSTQFMLAIKPDRVVITHNNRRIEAMKVLIGLDGGKLSADNAYQAIIHPHLLESS
ncbi:sigma-E processing peptidase SpoIIGA [Paenibacillus doosanensis]|uniref:Sporulation sigma-E factor-processing peptidase n=1 Tax=Paenibacillus konkukensis TaxID=2020716 RepID=A0ABY4RXI2_9BACL|nr:MULTISPECIES: sigma-E processing peptidase SpoIIGA [Paenibacillus]MCS7459272.1 sigma-E processing peptidase SpoIIGA [Paenibacillus doosanensis]UQZ87066.1 Sporulation factor SpoIIGA [Paenibacillus konkukensis]